MRRKVSGGGLALAVTYLVVELTGVVRVAVFAHFLAPASMGGLIVLGTWIRLVEMVTDLSLDRYLLQAVDGASKRIQNAAHGAALVRGCLGSAFMLVSLWPLLHAYGLHGSTGAFLIATLVPLIRGFVHLDYRIQNRFLRFRPVILVEFGGALAGLSAGVTGALLMPGPVALAGTFVAQALATVLISHLCSRRRYAAALDPGISRRFWRFGWPLICNALLLYAVFQGERLLVGGILGLEVLGSYGIVVQFALLPALIVGRMAISLFLPYLARSENASDRRSTRCADILVMFSGGGVIYWVAFVLLAPPILSFAFSSHYVPSTANLCWIAAAAAIRVQKTGPATVLLAAGRSRDLLAGSTVRVLSVLAGSVGMYCARDLTVFVACTAIGEALSHLSMGRSARRTEKLPALLLAAGPASVLFLAIVVQATTPDRFALSILAMAISVLTLTAASLHVALRVPGSRGGMALSATRVGR